MLTSRQKFNVFPITLEQFQKRKTVGAVLANLPQKYNNFDYLRPSICRSWPGK